jgi:DNA primase
VARSERPERGAYDLFRGRIIVPVEDDRGRLVAFGGRVPAGRAVGRAQVRELARDRHLPEVARALRAAESAAGHPARERAIVVEGYFDVIALHQAGFAESVATCGTALTAKHLETVRRLTPDGRGAVRRGRRRRERGDAIAPHVPGGGIEPLRLDLGGHKDPDELIKAGGGDAFESALSRAEPLFELVLRRAIHRHGITPGGREATLAELAPILRVFPEASRPVASSASPRPSAFPSRWSLRPVGKGRPDRAPPRPRRAGPGTRELNHLLWLLLHHPDQVTPVLVEATPRHSRTG